MLEFVLWSLVAAIMVFLIWIAVQLINIERSITRTAELTEAKINKLYRGG